MIESPEIIRIKSKLTAVIPIKVPREEMQHVFRKGVDELMAELARQGIAPTGALFAHHFSITPEAFDFEIGVPVDEPVVATGRVRAGAWPAMQVARTVYHGPYEGLPDAWGEFMEWIDQKGHKPGPEVWECYLSGPESSADPADWRTELNRPLVDTKR